MKFDVVIGNPPYQAPNKKAAMGSKSLWPKFVEKAFILCKPAGIIAYIHPPTWRKPNHKLFNLIKAKDLLYLKILSLKEGQKLFGASTAIDWYILKNLPYEGKTCITTVKETFEVDLTKRVFLPAASPENPLYNCFNDVATQEVLFSESDFFIKKGSRVYQEHYIPGFYSIKGTLVQEIYFEPTLNNKKKALSYLVPKVIIQLTGHKLHVYNDFDAKYVLPQFCCALPISSKDEGDKIVEWFNLNQFNLEDFNWGMTRAWRLFLYLKHCFWEIGK